MSTLAIKALILVVKAIAKPVSKGVQTLAAETENQKLKGVLIQAGNLANRWTHTINVRLIGGKKTIGGKKGTGGIRIRPLGDAEALARGGEVVGEMFVLSVALTMVSIELWRKEKVSMYEKEQKAIKKQERRTKKDKLLAEKFLYFEEEILTLRKNISILQETIKREEEFKHQTKEGRTTTKERESRPKSEERNTEKENNSWSTWFFPFYVQSVDSNHTPDV